MHPEVQAGLRVYDLSHSLSNLLCGVWYTISPANSR
jgi:hypothetical protein